MGQRKGEVDIMQPLISVVMNVFNGEATIRQTIESVIAQTYQNWELIIADDCSSDRTVEIIRSFDDPRIHCLTRSVRRHISYTINEAKAIARGEWVAHVDADDMWLPEKLAEQMAYVQAHPEVGACFTFACMVDGMGKPIDMSNKRLHPAVEFFHQAFHTTFATQKEWARQLFFQGNVLCHSGVMVRKELNLPALVCLRQLHDYQEWCDLVGKTRFGMVEKELVLCRWEASANKSSLSTLANENRLDNEYALVCRRRMIEKLTDEQLVAWFKEDFRNLDSQTPIELRIERAFLLLKTSLTNVPVTIPGVMALGELLQDPETVALLEDKYQFSLLDYYQMTGQDLVYSRQVMEALMPWRERKWIWLRYRSPIRKYVEKLCRR